MLTRSKKIGGIRDMIQRLWDEGRFELAKEILGEIHRDNFVGVSDSVVNRIWSQLKLVDFELA